MLSTSEHGYILPFEVVSILLLAAMIGCIVIAMKSPEQKAVEPKTIAVEDDKVKPAPVEIIHPPVSEPLPIEEA